MIETAFGDLARLLEACGDTQFSTAARANAAHIAREKHCALRAVFSRAANDT